MAAKLINLLAISSLAILACSFGATSANALVTDHNLLARHPAAGHAGLAQRKRQSSSTKRCKPRPTTSSAAAAAVTPTTTTDTTTHTTTSSKQAAASSTPASSQPQAGSGASSGGGSKIGIAWALGDDPSLANFKTGGPLYTWSPYLPTNARELGFNPIPQLWGDKQIGDFTNLVVEGYADTVLGFNEPDQSGQSNMSPQHAADVWKQYIQPLANKGYKLISPACTSAPDSKGWMQQFFAACTGCTFDGLAIHFYGTSAQDLINYITDFHTTFGLPIWVTEFADQNFSGGAQANQGEVDAFMTQATDFMNGQDWVHAYFWFGVMHDMSGVNPDNQLMQGNGQPNALGYQYLGGN
ncbi:glycoside hydrolase family 128 protein [Jaapia argillacea MUCL 33604]|uniref:Glycoside hydrolase family 128 protein n=1 Tax=Jaapia argillacea MUCL 33604 TaxID=933084 RepID=A0A067QCF4_9AGAM|nr:glycoside hydrolase family 128 protein [Jaapia argillacea MUCL 33604]